MGRFGQAWSLGLQGEARAGEVGLRVIGRGHLGRAGGEGSLGQSPGGSTLEASVRRGSWWRSPEEAKEKEGSHKKGGPAMVREVP